LPDHGIVRCQILSQLTNSLGALPVEILQTGHIQLAKVLLEGTGRMVLHQPAGEPIREVAGLTEQELVEPGCQVLPF
jgi:hypothetical protein